MRERFTRHSFIAVPMMLALFFFTGLINAYAVPIFGVTTTNGLVRFDSASPTAQVINVATITGLQAGENILGIDFRPANGQLYALGSTSRLYTINPRTGVATQVGAAGAFTLMGTDFGFDFNPVPDRIRVVSNTGQNLRLNPNDGTATVDPNLNPGTPNVTASAYTNNFAGATTTTLYDIDTNTDRLLIQNPANSGTLVDVGPLGVDATGINGFDIASRGIGSGVGTNMAFAALTVGGASGIYSINLTTGAATLVTNGLLPAGIVLRGIAISSFASAASRTLDFDGDNRTDLAVFRVATSTFFVRRSMGNQATDILGLQFGNSQTDDLVPADYNGDGITDFAVYRRNLQTNQGTFFVQNTATNQVSGFQFGLATDQAVRGDFDGDNRADFAVARRTPGASSAMRGTLTFFIQQSSFTVGAAGAVRAFQFGFDTDTPVPADYDGDNRTDIAVFRGENDGTGTFFIVQSSTGTLRSVKFGLASDLVISGDYDGDGRADIAVVRQGNPFQFFILRSSDNTISGVSFGEKPQIPVPGDYDGDGRTDIAVFDPRNGFFFILQSSTGTVRSQQFGQNGDIPLARSNTF